jgi:hypothetical protein
MVKSNERAAPNGAAYTMSKRRTRKTEKSEADVWADNYDEVHQKVMDAVSSLESGNTNMMTMTKEKTVRIYDPYPEGFIREGA